MGNAGGGRAGATDAGGDGRSRSCRAVGGCLVETRYRGLSRKLCAGFPARGNERRPCGMGGSTARAHPRPSLDSGGDPRFAPGAPWKGVARNLFSALSVRSLPGRGVQGTENRPRQRNVANHPRAIDPRERGVVAMRRLGSPRVLLVASLLAIGVFVYFAGMAWRPGEQFALGMTLTMAILIMRKIQLERHRQDPGSRLRLLVLVTGAFVVLRYILWRIQYTVPSLHDGALNFAFGWLLAVAELIAIGIFFLGAFVNLHPLRREPAPLPEDSAVWPTVDVFVPSYNEDRELLEVTLLAALNIRYPRQKLKVYLLDDGGTLQKRNDPDENKAREARQRHEELQTLCREVGAHYLTRERNEHAKAGNINAALPRTHGELILFLDADHVPTVDILENLVGQFLLNDKLFLVQSPHFFLNPDPVEKNIQVDESFPGEYEMFYTHGQRGLDFWNASFFCGSAALFRRRYLEEVGGISTDTITEDAETSLTLHSRGYDSAYIHRPMVAGLQPETFTGFITQRVRWCQGMLQMLRLKNPLLRPGLSLGQRLGYLNSVFYWLFPIPRTVFLFAPSLYLIFGIAFVNISFPHVLTYIIPYLTAVSLVANFFYGKVRWFLVSELYETVQSVFAIPVVLKTLIHPRGATFAVTPKGERLDHEFVSEFATPFYWALGFASLSIVAAIYRLVVFPAEYGQTLVALAWEGFNFIMISGALGVVLEKPQRRAGPRAPAGFSGELSAGEWRAPVEVLDISYRGVRLRAPQAPAPFEGEGMRLRFRNPVTGNLVELPCEVRNARECGGWVLGMRLMPESLAHRREIVAAAYGDSERWRQMLIRRNRQVGVIEGLRFVVRKSAVSAWQHVRFRVGALLRFGAARRERAAGG
ncbi:MAG: cellulose synthase catalytic subunit (UDP-forming) [Caldilineae bacterium]|nr:MAG: cellulose synthase catalytic subunit (UDP-forming) [Caldilineae bacterium]